MKKLALLCVLALMVSLVPTGLALGEEAAAVRVFGLVGPTGMSLAPLMAEEDFAYDYKLVAAPEELVGVVASGNYDIAALPTNLAAVLYQKTKGRVQMLAINTLGVLYVLEKGKIVEEGSHGALLENKGLYYAMWRQQIGERKSVHSYAAL